MLTHFSLSQCPISDKNVSITSQFFNRDDIVNHHDNCMNTT